MNECREKILLENMDTIKYIVRRVLNTLGISMNDFEDYLQEAYILLFEKVDKYDENKRFYNFAYSVIKNGFIDLYRTDSERKIEKISINETLSSDNKSESFFLLDLLKDNIDTENEALKNITIEMLKEYISDMKKSSTAHIIIKGFEALGLKIDGYSGEEIAKIFNVPSNSVRSWMSKARKIMVADKRVIDIIRLN